MGPNIAYSEMCQIVGDLFITRALENNQHQTELKVITQDYQRRIDELMKEREGLISTIKGEEKEVVEKENSK